MSPSQRLRGIPFDLYERYIPLAQIGELFRPEGSKYRVLDVGGHSEAFWPGFSSLAGTLIPGASVVVTGEGYRSGLESYIQASGAKLPFRDGAFDLVCATDALAQMAPEERAAFLAEILRVTRDGVYLAFPFDSPSNRWAEAVVLEYANAVSEPGQPVLEVRRFPLPDRDIAKAIFSATAYAWIAFELGSTDARLSMMLTYHTLRKASGEFIGELNRRFNQDYAARVWSGPAYRMGYLLSKRRSCADLEAAQTSFRPADTQTDPRNVLAFCDRFLTIAQNGRVIATKGRHIHRLEAELASARPYLEKWGEVAPVLRFLEGELLDTGAAGPPACGLTDWPPERISRLIDAARGLSATKLSEIAAQLAAIREQLADSLRNTAQLQSDSLRNSAQLQTRLDRRMRDMEIGLIANRRAVQAIYDSRIWKALCTAGGWLQRLAGGGAAARGRTRPPEGSFGSAATAPSGGPPDDFVAFVCDSPIDGSVAYRCDPIEIRGWSLAESGIDRVLIRINDDPPVAAVYGVPRPDVARSHPGAQGAGESGYRFLWDPHGLAEGESSVRVTAVARSGRSREIVIRVVIDWNEPPGYGLWITHHEPTSADLDRIRREADEFPVRPCISIALPVYKTSTVFLERCIESVIEQTYPNWELCIADDGSDDAELTALLRTYSERDKRIKPVALEQNRGISAATNAALRRSTGEYVAFLDHDDELAPFALSAVVQAINDNPDIELFYSDEDKIDEQGQRYEPFFKPGWSPDLFHSCNYICHFVVVKRVLLGLVGALNETYSGAQDYEFLLRATEHTPKIERIPKILYHWRATAGSTAKGLAEKPAAGADGERALRSHLERTAPGARVEEVGTCRYRVHYPITGDPRVSILIPTGGHKNVYRAVEDVLEKTAYKNYDILLIDNSHGTRVEEHCARMAKRGAPIRHVDWRGKPFNFSQMNNAAAGMTASRYLLFLNDDTSILASEWLTAMLEHAQRPEVGAVGALLWYPNNAIQHAGVVMGLYGNCSHAFKGVPGDLPHYYFDFPDLIRNCSAVTGACMLVARDKFFAAGAFDEVNLAIAFQDVDLCLKLMELGYRNVYTPYARLYHYESATKSDKDKIPDAAEDAFMKAKWAKYIVNDPYYNPNLTRWKEDFSLEMD